MKSLEKRQPLVALAPVDGVSDLAFRHIQIHNQIEEPDLVFTEFCNADGLIRGADKLFQKLLFERYTGKTIAQLFGKNPEAFFQAAQIVCELGFDGIDINMGCPARTVAHNGSGAGLIQTPELARLIVLRTYEGLCKWQQDGLRVNSDLITRRLIDKVKKYKNQKQETIRKKLTLSVKTRIGYEKPDTINWIKNFIDLPIDMLTIHARTYKQMYAGQADWQEIKKAADLVKNSSEIILLANGDIKDVFSAKECLDTSNADGVMIARASFGKPWVIGSIKKYLKNQEIVTQNDNENIKKYITKHLEKFLEYKQESHVKELRKHLAWYSSSFEGAKKLRNLFVKVESSREILEILDRF